MVFANVASASVAPPKPIAVCTFDDGEFCGWKNDANTQNSEWTWEQSALCLSTKARQTGKKGSFWIPSLRSSEKRTSSNVDINARLWSPSVPGAIGMKCLSFVFSIHLGRRANVQSSASLALLQRQE
uniref:MAM domain-containing protein n=1 Tax=Mesocestoides corti TaxID=53468 RepID=A0A5K3EYG4_MESCO